LLLFFATLLWAVAYDTLYAMADKADDVRIGVKSTAIAFGRFDKFWVAVCHLLTLGLYVLIGVRCDLGIIFYLSLVIALGIALYQQWLIRTRAPQACFKAFLNNQWFGAVLFAGVFLGLCY